MDTLPIIAVTMGDPAGIGPEIALKAALDPDVRRVARPVIVGSFAVLEAVAKALGIDAMLMPVSDSGDGVRFPSTHDRHVVPVLDLANITPANYVPGEVSAVCGRAAYAYIERAIELATADAVHAVATAPIHKEALHQAGVPFPGHTEIFTALTGSPSSAMMLVADNLRVSHVTTHVALADVPQLVRKERVLRVIALTHDALRRMGVASPKVAVAGVNPHCGEGGLFGDEETREIRPAVLAAQEQGIPAYGPFPADTLFVRAAAGEFDAVVAMYHDQGHIPVKLLGFKVDPRSGRWIDVTGVNVTLGLPIIRTSVDHGVAFDLAGTGTASHASMVQAIVLAAALAGQKREAPPG